MEMAGFGLAQRSFVDRMRPLSLDSARIEGNTAESSMPFSS